VSVDLDPVSWARRLHGWGSEDPAFDALMVVGPVVVLALAAGGRNLLTTVLAAAYVAGFAVAVARNALRGDDD
jgi:hypothetical protein